MNVSITQPNQNTCVIGFSGKFDFQSRHAFQGAMVQAEQASARQIILDFTDLSHIDSAGLGLLSLAHKKLSAMGSRMVIANAQDIVRDILLLTNMEKMFPLYDSVAAASQQTRIMMLQN
jgi:anti-anti-sigma factor